MAYQNGDQHYDVGVRCPIFHSYLRRHLRRHRRSPNSRYTNLHRGRWASARIARSRTRRRWMSSGSLACPVAGLPSHRSCGRRSGAPCTRWTPGPCGQNGRRSGVVNKKLRKYNTLPERHCQGQSRLGQIITCVRWFFSSNFSQRIRYLYFFSCLLEYSLHNFKRIFVNTLQIFVNYNVYT